jgi:23S rRNA pseudouridine2605 synthase
LLTNDGELANRIAHPSHGIEKEYLVEVDGGPVSAARCGSLRDGVELDDGPTAPAKVSQPDPGVLRSRSTRAATGRSGGCARPSVTRVTRLVRTRIGPISDRSTAAGVLARADHRRVAGADRGGGGDPAADGTIDRRD